MARKTPQEKKRLSYLKDRRNDYGEHDKGSRRSIRTRKSAVNSANRRQEHVALTGYAGPSVPADAADAVDQSLFRRRRKSWQKGADEPLGAVVIRSLERRVRMGIEDEVQGHERIRRVRSRLGDPI